MGSLNPTYCWTSKLKATGILYRRTRRQCTHCPCGRGKFMMMMNTSRFIFPPRTELACEMDNNDSLKMFLAFDDVIGQLKLNGSRICIYISPTNKI